MKAWHGFLNVNKALGMTSHDVVAKIRRKLRQAGVPDPKVGHAGTLDPLATGVLVICLQDATRLSDYVMASVKQYRATVRFGVTTNTYDAEGDIIATHNVAHVSLEDVTKMLPRFTGEIQQVPPMYSAIKQGGRKLYDLARAGETVERAPRQVTIFDVQVISWQVPDLVLDVTCGAGTYIRSLAHDLGETLGVGAHLTALCRTRSGAFHLEHATDLETLLGTEDWQPHLITPRHAFADWQSVWLSAEQIYALRQGKAIAAAQPLPMALALAYDEHDELVAVVRVDDEWWRPYKVFGIGKSR